MEEFEFPDNLGWRLFKGEARRLPGYSLDWHSYYELPKHGILDWGPVSRDNSWAVEYRDFTLTDAQGATSKRRSARFRVHGGRSPIGSIRPRRAHRRCIIPANALSRRERKWSQSPPHPDG